MDHVTTAILVNTKVELDLYIAIGWAKKTAENAFNGVLSQAM